MNTTRIQHFGIFYAFGKLEELAKKMDARGIRHDDADLRSDALRLYELLKEAQEAYHTERRQILEQQLKASVEMMKARKEQKETVNGQS